jgi:hypothetical protein
MKVKFRTLYLIIFGLLFLNLTVFCQEVSEQTEQVDSNILKKQDGEKLKKFEISGQFTSLYQKSVPEDSPLLRLPPFNGVPIFLIPKDNHQTEFGIGGRVTYNLNKHIAIEAEVNFFPSDRLSRTGKERDRIFNTPEAIRNYHEPQGRKIQLNAGPKIGYRGKKIGIFGKVRPGLFYVGRYPIIEFLSFTGSTTGVAASERKTAFFSVDVGGVAEFYPSKRTILRFDIGDTIIKYRSLVPKNLNPGFTKHTLQTSIGFGFRF